MCLHAGVFMTSTWRKEIFLSEGKRAGISLPVTCGHLRLLNACYLGRLLASIGRLRKSSLATHPACGLACSERVCGWRTHSAIPVIGGRRFAHRNDVLTYFPCRIICGFLDVVSIWGLLLDGDFENKGFVLARCADRRIQLQISRTIHDICPCHFL